jgi:predicted nucleic acid-binding protein
VTSPSQATLLDTCVLIDVLRGKDAAIGFVSSLQDTPALSVATVMELMAGCRNAKERRQIDRLLSHYVIYEINADIASLAGDYIRQYGPSHGTDPIDALIAATANAYRLPLATLNIRRFPMFEGLTRPYQT